MGPHLQAGTGHRTLEPAPSSPQMAATSRGNCNHDSAPLAQVRPRLATAQTAALQWDGPPGAGRLRPSPPAADSPSAGLALGNVTKPHTSQEAAVMAQA